MLCLSVQVIPSGEEVVVPLKEMVANKLNSGDQLTAIVFDKGKERSVQFFPSGEVAT